MVLPHCVAVSQFALSTTAQVRVPVPGFVTVMVLDAGLLPPVVPLNAKQIGLSPIVGCAGLAGSLILVAGPRLPHRAGPSAGRRSCPLSHHRAMASC